MDVKQEILSILKSLKKKGFSRRRIEQEINRADRYLDQIIAKGGNESVLHLLKEFQNKVESGTVLSDSFVREPVVEYDKKDVLEVVNGLLKLSPVITESMPNLQKIALHTEREENYETAIVLLKREIIKLRAQSSV